MPNGQIDSPARRNGARAETKLPAKVVSRGTAVGRAVCLYGLNRQFFKLLLDQKEIPTEVERFSKAVERAAARLRELASSENNDFPGSSQSIFDAHLAILEDSSFTSKIESMIREASVNAEWAVKSVADEYVARYRSIDDEHLRERYIDIEDVSERILTALGGGGDTPLNLDSDSIIIAKELRPSTIIELHENRPLAIVAEHGGWTSHTFILARELGIPAVTGVRKALRRLETGDPILVDANEGFVLVNPGSDAVSSVAEVRSQPITDGSSEQRKTKTLDGREVSLKVNADLASAYKTSLKFGSYGIGLYRSEYLFNQFGGFPDETTQFAAYRRLADTVGDAGVCIRTFDIGVGQLMDRSEDKERNPALGLRAIRLSLTYDREFRVQLRAIMRAAHERKVSILLPMITGIAEIDRFYQIYNEERISLENAGVAIGDPEVGVMIEVPSAVAVVEHILDRVDFLCLGTNDLIQYLLAVDRDNETVASWFQTLHPAVIDAVGRVLAAGEVKGKTVTVCGEMAGSPYYAPVLIGLGAVSLSMNANAIPRVRRMVAGIAYDEARELAKAIGDCASADEVDELLRNAIESKWKHLLPADMAQRSMPRYV